MQVCHIDLLKPYFAHSPVPSGGLSLSSLAVAMSVDHSPPPFDLAGESEEELYTPDDGILRGCFKNSDSSCQSR